LSYPECYPCQWRAGVGRFGIGWARVRSTGRQSSGRREGRCRRRSSAPGRSSLRSGEGQCRFAFMSVSLKSLGIDRLGVEERIALVEEIWDSIAADSAAVPLTTPQRDELDRRLADHASHPNDVVSWDEQRRISSRGGCCGGSRSRATPALSAKTQGHPLCACAAFSVFGVLPPGGIAYRWRRAAYERQMRNHAYDPGQEHLRFCAKTAGGAESGGVAF